MKMSDAALSNWVLGVAIAGGILTVITAFIAQEISKRAKLQGEKDKNEILAGHLEIEKLGNKNHREDLEFQLKIALIQKEHAEQLAQIQKEHAERLAQMQREHADENREILEGVIEGPNSHPVLYFGYITEEQTGYVALSNLGDDPALSVTGTFNYYAGGISVKYPPITIGPFDVPRKYKGSSLPIRINIGQSYKVFIEATFWTRAGAHYHQFLFSERLGKTWIQAYRLMDLNNNERTVYFVDPQFAVESYSQVDRAMIQDWAKKQEEKK